MECFSTAIVADISSSIGMEIAYQLILKKIHVYGLFTAESDVKALRDKLDKKNANKLYLNIIRCDTHTENDVKRLFPDINVLLINCISFENESFSILTDNDADTWQPLIAAKLQRMEMYSREVMKSKHFGYILNISSPVGSSGFCSAWRDAVLSLSEKLRNEISEFGNKIKVTTITEDSWTGKSFMGLSINELIRFESQRSSDIAEAVMHAITSYKWNANREIIVTRPLFP